MVNNTNKEISEVIKKISENLSGKLSQDKAQKFLMDTNKDLVKIKKNVEEEYKEIVEKKINGLEEEIDEALSNELGWGGIKVVLKGVKIGLEELETEIMESEKTAVVPFIATNKLGLEELEKKLAEWEKLFANKTPEEVANDLKEFGAALKKERYEHKEQLDKIQAEIEEEAKKGDSDRLYKLSKTVTEAGLNYVESGSNVGKDSGLGIFLSPAGAMIGAGVGLTHGIIGTGAYLTEEGMKYGDKTREGLKDFTENIVSVGADSLEKTRKGAQEVTEKVLENLDFLGTTKNIIGGLTGGIVDAEKVKAKAYSDAEIAKSGVDGLKKMLEEKENQIKELKERLKEKDEEREKQIEKIEKKLEEQIKKLEGRLQKKDDRIEKLEEKVEEYEKKAEKAQEKLIAEIEVNRAPSPLPFNKNQ